MPDSDVNLSIWPDGTVLVLDREGLLWPGFDPVAVTHHTLSTGLVDHPVEFRTRMIGECAAVGAERFARRPALYPRPLDRPGEHQLLSSSDTESGLFAFDFSSDPEVQTLTPFVVLPGPEGFQAHIHRAMSFSLDADDLEILARLRRKGRPSEIVEWSTLDAEECRSRLARLVNLGFIRQTSDMTGVVGRNELSASRAAARRKLLVRLNESLGELGSSREWAVIGVATSEDQVPLALGYVLATLATDQVIGQVADCLLISEPQVDSVLKLTAGRKVVWLFSDYVWNVARNCRISEKIKGEVPHHFVIHGGPSVPKYDGDLAAFLQRNPAVDAGVIGEGELSALELVGRMIRTGVHPQCWSQMPAGTARFGSAAGLIRGADRDRIDDLARIPSPYLSGILDAYDGSSGTMAVLETNRGCPYNCTFCDWGSATSTRIRSQPLERVFAELEWIAGQRFTTLLLADANFGILPRDVEIAEFLADLKRRTGFPLNFVTNYAKNPNPRLLTIMEVLRSAGLFSLGTIAVQSTDEAVLKAVRRSNIGLDKYQALHDALRDAGVPLSTDLVVGLPAATVNSWRGDLQFLIDAEIRTNAYRCQVLPNSPMNDPGYKAEWGIQYDSEGLVYETKSASRDDLRQMLIDFAAVYGADGLGWFRLPLRKIAQQTNEREVDLICRLQEWVLERQEEFPLSAFLFTAGTRWAIGPAPWDVVFAELRRAAESCWGARHWAAWSSVVAAQQAVLPQVGDAYPKELNLEHDVVAWWQAVSEAKRAHPGAWRQHAVRLALAQPGSLRIGDSEELVQQAFSGVTSLMVGARWEMDTQIARQVARPALGV